MMRRVLVSITVAFILLLQAMHGEQLDLTPIAQPPLVIQPPFAIARSGALQPGCQ